MTMRSLLDFPTMKYRLKMATACAHLKRSAKKDYPLPELLSISSGNLLNRCKSWVGGAADTVQLICRLTNINHRE
uniref:Uncharacterized protein n=1 Tax=Arion vulgaris TaxID=1028688 RepID=A0A0B7AUK3_9EUPU